MDTTEATGMVVIMVDMAMAMVGTTARDQPQLADSLVAQPRLFRQVANSSCETFRSRVLLSHVTHRLEPLIMSRNTD